MSIALVVTRGYSNGSLVGTIPFVVTRGYTISTVIPPTIPTADGLTVGGKFGDGVAVSSSFGTGVKVDGKL